MLNPSQELGQKRALLVGINHYFLDDAIGNLEFCVNDVVELDGILSDKLRGNFTSEIYHTELGERRFEPNRSNIMSMVQLLSNNSERNDSILFYFAGHGFEHEGVNYLLPSDAKLNVLPETAISLKWVKETLAQSPAKKKFMVIDACHAGSRIGRAQSLPMTTSFKEEMFSNAEGFAILSSCQIGQQSYDFPENNHGVFSYYLLEGLKGSADFDSDHIITVPDINNYVSHKMREWSLSKRLEQNPTFEYNVSGDFIFVKIPYEGSVDLSSKFVIPDTTTTTMPIENESNKIKEILEELSFMSDEDVSSSDSFDYLDYLLFIYDEREERIVEASKLFLKEIIITRFSSSLVKYHLMPIIAEITNFREIKRWLKNEPEIKQYLILEYISSQSFDYAGTMARIINNLLPALSNDELLEIIEAIKENDQIKYSFRARRYVLSIIDSAKSIISLQEYRELMSIF